MNRDRGQGKLKGPLYVFGVLGLLALISLYSEKNALSSVDVTATLAETYRTATEMVVVVDEVVDESSSGAQGARNNQSKEEERVVVPVLRGKVWICGWPLGGLAQRLFPDYEYMGTLDPARTLNRSASDILLFGMHGPCPSAPSKASLLSNFQGKILYANGEPHGSIHPQNDGERVFQIGGPILPKHSSGAQSDIEYYQKHIIRGVYHGIYVYVNKVFENLHYILDPSQRRHFKPNNTIATTTTPTGNGTRPAFSSSSRIIYANSHVVSFRQQVGQRLAKHFQLETGGDATVPGAKRARIPKKDGWTHNWKYYSKYKYCLNMENTRIDGYISEKLLNGVYSGCLTIYHGTQEIFNIFNPDAFIYIDDSEPIDKLVETLMYLEQNQTAYEEKLAVPVLKNGQETIDQYFSLSDSIGDGSLKFKIRSRMGLE